MSVQNGSFEAVGAYPGAAQGWTLRAFVAGERVAPFGANPRLGFESFDWALAPADLVAQAVMTSAAFDPAAPTAYEGFEHGWDNSDALFDLTDDHTATAALGGAGGVDDFDWTALLDDWGDVAEAAADLDGAGGPDAFDWTALLDDWGDVAESAFVFTADTAETFDDVAWPAMSTL